MCLVAKSYVCKSASIFRPLTLRLNEIEQTLPYQVM